jgi:kinesin family member 18/19
MGLILYVNYIVRVRPFNRKEIPLVLSIDPPPFSGNASLAVTPRPKLTPGGIRKIVEPLDDRVLIFDPHEMNPVSQYSKMVLGEKNTKDIRFVFDRVLDESCDQADVSPFSDEITIKVFACTAEPLLDEVLNGFNASIFAYGATGSGKTHTILYVQLDKQEG